MRRKGRRDGRRGHKRQKREHRQGHKVSYVRAFMCHMSKKSFHVSEQEMGLGEERKCHVKNNVVIYC